MKADWIEERFYEQAALPGVDTKQRQSNPVSQTVDYRQFEIGTHLAADVVVVKCPRCRLPGSKFETERSGIVKASYRHVVTITNDGKRVRVSALLECR